MAAIDQNTLITKGLPLSPNFLLDHLSTGAYHFVLGRWTPTFTSPLTTQNANSQMPLWKIVANLQNGAQNILEPLLREFGGDLILRSGFNPTSMGNSFDIQINGYQGNMYGIMKELQNMLPQASSLGLFQGSGLSFSRINFNDVSTSVGSLKSLPNITSFDLLNNTSFQGLQVLQGLF